MAKMLPEYRSSSVIRRYAGGEPVLSKKDIPYEADCIFNAGVTKYKGQYCMVFRNDYRFDGKGAFGKCSIGVATSSDGIKWNVEDRIFLSPEDLNDPDVTKVYDPRLTVIGDELYMCFAVDTHHGVRGGIARIHNFNEEGERVEVLHLTTPDNRNMVLFPEKIDGKYVRLERPFPVYSRGGVDRFDIWISYSYDLKYWGDTKLLLAVEDVPFANDKIGPGAPPVKTDDGWLVLFHTVDIDRERGKNGWEEKWQKRYCAGVMLLDSKDPGRVIGVYKEPLIAPETVYETDEGFRTNVVFPGGLVAESDGTVKIYYGASDTVECMAEAKLADLIKLCYH
ncbi:MAG: glycoside hydrolase family 130 protein [Lachnospiraceae bacterium]|nr:glycoside hydrolase family 130 protein [Lachnospiraceae bacterium]